MKSDERPWGNFLLELLSDDPEWAAYVAGLSPSTPLRRAVESYLRFVKARVQLTPEEVAAADRVLALMEQRGYSSPDEMVDAIERGEVKLRKTAGRKRKSAVSGWQPGRA